jgi:hypothetical protein
MFFPFEFTEITACDGDLLVADLGSNEVKIGENCEESSLAP